MQIWQGSVVLQGCMVLLLALAGGCQQQSAAKVFVPIEEVPAEIMAIAEKTLPDVKFESARKIKVKGEDVLEIRGKNTKGKVREVEVSMKGEVVEIE